MISERCRKLPARGFGGVPQPNIPQDWGIKGKGVEVDYFSTLYDESLPEGE
jgi:hypothetical protein